MHRLLRGVAWCGQPARRRPLPRFWLSACCWLAGALKDDALLEAVVLLGALAGWAEGDKELADSGLVRTSVEFRVRVCP